jgi:hypothetical protein
VKRPSKSPSLSLQRQNFSMIRALWRFASPSGGSMRHQGPIDFHIPDTFAHVLAIPGERPRSSYAAG